ANRLRKWLIKYNYNLVNEKVIEENAHFYEILVAEKSNKSNVYSESIDLEKQIYFGPYLIKERSVEFINKWEEEKKKLSRIIKEILMTKKSNKSNVYNESIELEKQIYFGQYIIKERSVEFINKWEEEKKKLSRIIKEMKQAKLINHKKVNQFTKKLNWIEEVLSNESCNKQ